MKSTKFTTDELDELIELEKKGIFGIVEFVKDKENENNFIGTTPTGRKVKYINCRKVGNKDDMIELKYDKAFWMDTNEEVK
jgi:hypothetical protein